MKPSNFNLRGIPPQVMSGLKRQAKELKMSVNLLIIRSIEQGMSLGNKPKRAIHHDLDFLIGTWSTKECRNFDKKVNVFEKIDEELWK